MSEVFYGPWDVTVLSKDAAFDERITITGSSASDGSYPAVPGGGPGPVDGARWELRAEWNDNAGSGWQESGARRWATYTLADGLVVTIGADDNLEAVRDYDYNDLVVVCRSLDPRHTPHIPVVNPYDFTVPEEVLRRYYEQHPREPDGVDDPGNPDDPKKPDAPSNLDDPGRRRGPRPPK